ncbi:hypothetical protein BUALT_Bualt14G0106700 [Buddleja alternifolia]|uniref:Uncharacterized protein n=1 Tax=Buddleja alternifolia TaxID=168488 RepID=A0AAV6WIL7_9LAMI|nr:hypothetical protein BUALT_Bualt14G0106700 [Buddleja alternifolia]
MQLPSWLEIFFGMTSFDLNGIHMLAYVKILEECPDTGMMVVHWIKKFLFFCSDREYVIGRRIWEAGKTYYCLSKRKGDSQCSACEILLIHYEDMGIPKDVAKLGVRHGM